MSAKALLCSHTLSALQQAVLHLQGALRRWDLAAPSKRTELGTGAGMHNCAATQKYLRSHKGVVVDVEEAKCGEAVPEVGERALQAHVGDVQAGDD